MERTQSSFTWHDLVVVLGCVPLWLCPRAASLMLVELQDGPGALSPGAMMGWYGFFALGVALVIGLMVRFPRQTFSLPVLIGSGVAGCVGVMLVVAAPGPLGLGAGLLGMAVFVGIQLSCAAETMVRESFGKVTVLVTASCALANGLRALSGSLDLELETVQALFPLISTACFVALPGLRPQGPRCPVPLGAAASLRMVSWPVVGASTVLIALWSLALGVLSQGQNWQMDAADKTVSFWVSAAVLLALALWSAATLRRGSMAASVLYPFTALAVSYMMVLLAMILIPGVEFVRFKRVLIAIEQCLEVFLLAFLLADAARRHLGVPALVGFCVVFLTNSPWIVMANRASDVLGAAFVGDAIPVVLSFVTSIVLIGLLLGQIRGEQARETVASDRDYQRNLCQDVADRCGLSGKELEVLNLLYRGNSAKKIAGSLCVSESTVHSHTTSIYRKLGVHSRQEAIDYVDRHR